jgi:FKBP-type peptidyl-prolyl cis-trans isomerase FkpA
LEIQSINRRVETHVREKNVELKAQIDDQNKAKGLECLVTNAKRTGIIVTDSGLQYEILKNSAASKPKSTDTVKVNYIGMLLDGTEFGLFLCT